MQILNFLLRLPYVASLIILSFIGCKKAKVENSIFTTRTTFEQSVFYKVNMTIPSPADSARGFFKDSIKARKTLLLSVPDSFTNILYLTAKISPNFPGFSIGYDDDNNLGPYFAFTGSAFPNVPREFSLNTPYEYTKIIGPPNFPPIFLGTHSGNSGMNYFVDNVLPSDASAPTFKVYTKVIFTDKLKTNTARILLLASGKISGYIESNWGIVNPNKYIQRWDFEIDFTDLILEE